MSKDKKNTKKKSNDNENKEVERIKPKLDPYKRSKVRDNDRHGRYEDEETY
jgi:hypothetical protein